MSSAAVNLILEKIASKDKDFRYMATSDLLNEISKDTFKVDPDLEKKLCTVISVQLEDQSGDISGLAVKCLGILVRKVGEARAVETIKDLCDKVVTTTKKEQARDIANIGLKTVIAEISGGSLAASTAALVTGKMLEGIHNKDSFDIVSDSLDILNDVISKFGNLVAAEHGKVTNALLPFLDNNRTVIRKRGLQSLAALSAYLNDEQLATVISHVLSGLQSKSLKPDIARAYIQAVGHISRAVGYRFGKHLPVTVPLVIDYCQQAKEGDDELREYCLQALESFVQKCPHDAKAFLEPYLAVALQYLKYDPNFADDMEEDQDHNDGDDDGGDDDEDEVGSDDDYSDDEDMSWKVRRAAAKCLSAVIPAYPELLPDIYKRCGGEMVGRFREREENVKMDIFHAYCDLLQQVGNVSSRFAKDDPNSPLELLRADVATVLKAAGRQLGEKSLKTKVGVFTVLRSLVAVLPDSIADHVKTLVPGILAACNDKSGGSSNLKIEALGFLTTALDANDPSVFQPYVAPLSSGVFNAVNERYYKVVAQALRVCEQFAHIIRPNPPEAIPSNLTPVVSPLFDAVNKRLSAQDQDQEVKECAILCMARIVANLGDVLSKQVPAVLKVLLDRLRNDTTRLPAVKAFTIISASPLDIPLSGVIEQVLLELTGFLRKANRSLRQAALAALDALAAKSGSQLQAADVAPCVEEAAALVSDADLSLTAVSLRLFCTLLEKQPAVAPATADKVLPAALALLRSPLLQGAALSELQAFFPALARSNAPQAQPEVLLAALLEEGQGHAGTSKQAQHSVAQCVAVLCTSSDGRLQGTVQQLLGMLQGKDTGAQRLALLCLAEIGRRSDLGSQPKVEAAISNALGSDSEDIKSAASLALGGVTCGNLHAFLPSLLQKISAAAASPKEQYLLLQALNEVLVTITTVGQSSIDLSEADQDKVLQLLLSNCEGEEECRNVVAECLGRLALLHPSKVLTQLQQRLTSPVANVRCVVGGAVKHMVTDKPHPVDAVMKDCLLDFLKLIGDEDRHVRKAAVVALSAVAHHKPELVAVHLPALLPLLYDQTVTKPELVRTVDLGPFKHKIDDGLELRKAAFECLDILLDSCPDTLDRPTFLHHLELGLTDHYDVKMPAHLMLSKLASSSGGAVSAQLEGLINPLEKTLTARLKSDSVKQEIDRHEDMIRSCLRAVDALNRIPGVESCAPFQAFMKRTVLAGTLKDKFTAIEKERAEAEGVSAADAMDLS